MPVTNFTSVISAQTVGTADVEKLAASFDKVSASIDGVSQKANKVNEHSGFNAFAEKVKAGLSDPLGSAGNIAEGFLTKLGPLGAAAAGIATSLIAVGAAGMSFARDLGHLSDEIGDTAVRMGLTTKETQEFRFAMKYAGGDIGTLEGIMRKLSAEIDSGGENLQKMGIQFRNSTTGEIRPMSEVVLQLSERLRAIPDVSHRNAEAIKVLGKSALAVLPDLLELGEGVAKAQQLGIAFSQQQLDGFTAMHKRMVEVDQQWDFLVHKLKAGVTVPIMWFIGDGSVRDKGMRGPSMFDTWDSDIIGDSLRKGTAGLLGRGRDQMNAPSIARSDTAIKSLLAGQDDSGQLQEAKKTLAELVAKLPRGVTESASQQARDDVAAQQAVVKSIEGRIKATKDLADAEKQLEAFERQMYAKDMGPVSRIFAQGDELIKDKANAGRTRSAVRIGASAELSKDEATVAKQSFDLALRAGVNARENWDEVYKTLNRVGENSAKAFIEAAKAAAQVADELDRIQVGSERSEIMSRSGKALNLANIRMGPGQEGAAITFAYQERLRLARELYDFEMEHANTLIEQTRAEADQRKALFDAEVEHELQIAELQRRRLDERKAMGAQLFDSILGGGDGLAQFGKNFIQAQGRTIAGNLFSDATKNMSGAFGSSSKYLQGTIFGQDPLKGATDANTLATVENTAALRSIAMSSSGGGGGFSSAGGTFARIAAGGMRGTDLEGGWGWDPNNPDAITPAGAQAGEDWWANNPGGGMSSTARGIGIGGAAIGGVLGIYAGARQGGVRGGLNAGGAAAGAASAIMMMAGATGPLAPILMGVGMALPFISSLFGDPKQKRADELSSQAKSRAYTMPSGADYSMDARGNDVSYDYRGNTRVTVVNNINAMDSGSFRDFLVANPDALSKGITSAILGGNGDDVVGALSART